MRWSVLLFAVMLPDMAAAEMPDVAQSNWRYDEDWSALRALPKSGDDPWWRAAKYQPLHAAGSDYVSFGLEVRARYEGFRGNLWGGGDAPDDAYLWVRAMPHMDVHAGPLRAFVQPILATARGVGAGDGPADATGIDMLQAFADLDLPLGENAHMVVRGGRALTPLGSERLVGTRYGPNVPQAFDGVRLSLRYQGVQAELIGVKPVAPGPDDFDDRTSSTKRLRGVYATVPVADGLAVDTYWLDYRNEAARFAQAVGDEKRRTYGVRIFGERGGWAWNWEAMLQRGHFESARIRAWSLATETAYRFEDAPLAPRLRLRANVASGDGNPTDNILGTFNPMFPKGKYFGELSPIGPYNIANIHPSIDFDLGGGVSFDLAGVAYWRASRRDGVYDVPGQLLRTGAANARFIGAQTEAVLGWQVSSVFSAGLSASLFLPGGFIRETGRARTIGMVGFETMMRF